MQLLGKKPKDETPTDEVTELSVDVLTAEEYRQVGRDVFFKRVQMRDPLNSLLARLAINLCEIRPFNQKYDGYPKSVLLVLKELLQPELEAINEALIRKL